jgi:phage recombination protein Bet
MTDALQIYTPSQMDIIRQQIAPGCTPADLALFIEVCQRTGLDPFTRQIYAIARAGKMTIMVSIDGMRLQAQRSGRYRGQTPAQWCGEDGVWLDVWLSDRPPAAARVGVLHADFREPLIAVARWRSYAQRSSTWQQMPDVMLAKCAESLALRRAFPAELSGLYTREEIGHDAPAPVIVQRQDVEHDPTALDVERLLTALSRIGVASSQVAEHLGHDITTMTRDEYQILIALGQAMRRGLTWQQALDDLHGAEDLAEEEPEQVEE